MAIDKNNYRYTINNSTETVAYWICAEKGCNSRISTRVSTNNLLNETLPDHPSHGNKLLKRKIRDQENQVIKRLAKVQGASNAHVINEITVNVQQSEAPTLICGMRSRNALKVAIWREKCKVNPSPSIPKPGDFSSFMAGQLPEKFTKTHDGSEFLILQSWTDDTEEDALLVFLSDTGAEIFRTHQVWLLDGTFKTTPCPFKQVYVIMAKSENGGQGLACGFALLPNKAANTYELMMSKIFEKVGNNSNLSVIVCDFEQAMWRTIGVLAHQDVQRRGCQFHFRKAIYSKLGELGLQPFYNGNVEFNELVHKVFALSFIPVEDVVKVFEEHIVSQVEKNLDPDTGNSTWIEGSDELEDFIRYLGRTWIGKPTMSRAGNPSVRRPPLYQHDIWNMYQGIMVEDPVVTNNTLESWNRTWNQEMGSKPNIWRVIQGFVDKESETKRILVANAAGRDMNTNSGRKSLVQNHHRRIASIARQYITLPTAEYLALIAHELSLH